MERDESSPDFADAFSAIARAVAVDAGIDDAIEFGFEILRSERFGDGILDLIFGRQFLAVHLDEKRALASSPRIASMAASAAAEAAIAEL